MITLEQLYKSEKLEKTEFNKEFEEGITQIYDIKKGNVLLIGPDNHFINQLINKYNNYFSTVNLNLIASTNSELSPRSKIPHNFSPAFCKYN